LLKTIQLNKKNQRYNLSKFPETKEELTLESKGEHDNILDKTNDLQNTKGILGHPRKKIKLKSNVLDSSIGINNARTPQSKGYNILSERK
jgi:hypothetical protein